METIAHFSIMTFKSLAMHPLQWPCTQCVVRGGVGWSGLAWYGMVWYEVAWCGMVWCGVMWYVVLCYAMYFGLRWMLYLLSTTMLYGYYIAVGAK